MNAAICVAAGFTLYALYRKEFRSVTWMLAGTAPAVIYFGLGILDPDTLVVHAVWTDADDIRILKKRGVTISHNAESNMKLGAGIALIAAIVWWFWMSDVASGGASTRTR